jgi:hypothetical protein
MSAQVEQWRVDTPEGIFETDLETLKQWIVEGCVSPTDKVSKGSLNWIEAGRAPMLRAAFKGEAVASAPATPALVATETDATPGEKLAPEQSISAAAHPLGPNSAHFCHNHPEAVSKFICRQCQGEFCDECPSFHGSSKIPLCPLCGDLCSLVEQIKHRAARQQLQSSGFGFADFVQAIRYPFQHKVALVFGAGLYAFLLLGGFRGRLIASVIMFGCISHVISQVAWGRWDRNFMPDFSEFSLWEDVAVPFVLGLGITVVTWGPTIVLLIALLYGAFSGPAPSPLQAMQTPVEQKEQQLNQEAISVALDPNADPEQQAEAAKRIDQMRPGYQINREAEQSERQLNDPAAGARFLLSYFGASLLFVGLLLLGLGWAIFYYPMALAVAGYTQSFGSVVNPLVGLDTIRRMGKTYFKAFGMVLLIQVVGFSAAVVVAVITAPLALPFVGNMPAMFIDGSLTFYTNLVVACVLGLSLYKCADRLGISVD